MYNAESLQDHEAVQLISEISGRPVADVAALAAQIADEQGEQANIDAILAMGVLAAMLNRFESAGLPTPTVITV